MYVRSKIPLQILQDSCSKSCKTLVWFLHARLCTVHILHGSKTCKKSCKGRLARLLQGLVRLWPLLLQYARFLSKYIRFSCKMCQILMQTSLQASCKSLMYGLDVKSVISSFNDWSDQSEDNETRFVKLDHGSVTHSIIFTPDLHWKLYIHLFANIVYYVI